MDRNQAKDFSPILQAFAEGKEIECRNEPDSIKGLGLPNDWTNVTDLFFMKGLEYRIKPEPKYRPFANAKECWQEMTKHQPFGWVKCKEDGSLGLITLIINEASIYVNGIGSNSERTMRGFTFADGTPFGILEDE